MEMKKMIEEVIGYEWEMFSEVNGGNNTSECGCDEEFAGFSAMRQAQFDAWDEAVVAAYLNDLKAAKEAGRNLVTEKYIHMMKNTEPAGYEQVKGQLVPLSDEQLALSDEICAMMIEETVALNEKYPLLSCAGRPLYSSEDNESFTSVETYQKGELYTFSVETLKALKAQLVRMHAEGKSLAALIQENSVKYYGYDSLDHAENAIRHEMEDTVYVEPNFGCPACNGKE